MTFYFCTRFTSNLFHGQLLLCALIELIRQSLALSEKKGSAALQKTTPTGACVSRSQTHIVRTDAVKGEAAPPQACFHLHPFFPPRMQEPTESSLPDWVHAAAFWAACIAAGFANIFFFSAFWLFIPSKGSFKCHLSRLQHAVSCSLWLVPQGRILPATNSRNSPCQKTFKLEWRR